MGVLSDFKTLTSKEEYLLRQFVNSLKVQMEHLNVAENALIRELLNNSPGWQEAYQAEALMIDLLPETELKVLWQRNLSDLNELPYEARVFYRVQADSDLPDDQLRPLLRQLLHDLHWCREQNRVKRLHEGHTRRNVVLMFLFAFVLFFLPTILRLSFGWTFDNLRLYYIFTAASAGFLGASFSQLFGLRNSLGSTKLEQAKAMSKLIYVLARAVIGAGAGLIMFYLLQSGLMEGVLFPQFIQSIEQLTQLQAAMNGLAQSTSLAVEQTLQLGGLARPSQDLSLLIVWCLLAGFSEKLIPSLLEKNREPSGFRKH